MLKYKEDSIQAMATKVKEFPYQINVTAVCCPTWHNLNEEHFETFLQTLLPKFIGGKITTTNIICGAHVNNNKRQRIMKGRPREKLFISIIWNTNILAYWQKQNPGSTIVLCNKWDLLNINRHKTKLLINRGSFPNSNNVNPLNTELNPICQ